ncbi:MAG: exodeoxyribonuclease VII small subunit [Patescibacteria group bacterium]|nr:exodeoxyribonuclease VII small subunit [Patescibacteria group bacterium]
MAKQKNFDFAAAMRELEEINRWFQEADIDLDQGLEKLKKGKELIAACRDRLKSVENEFIKIREDFAAPVTDTAITGFGKEEEPVGVGTPVSFEVDEPTRPPEKSRIAAARPDDDLPF